MAGSTPENNPDYLFLSGGGQMGELIRSIDWTTNPLGDPAEWPIALKQAASMMLKNNFPVLICWGPDYIQLYNDAFRPINGENKHPQAMGSSARITYAEIWNTIGPMFADVMNGETHGFPNFAVTLDRNGKKEDCYFDFSYSSIADISNQALGVLVICVETTEKMRAIREYEVNELKTKHKDQELQLMIDILPASVVVIRGPELIVEMINRSNLSYWNKTTEEVIGKPFLEILPDLADQPFAGQLRQVMATGEVIDVKESPVLFENVDGTIRETFVDYTYQPLTNSSGQRDGVLVMSFEITERVAARKLLEEINARLSIANSELARSEARFKYLIQEAPVAIAVLHSQKLIITSANELILKIWGKNKSVIDMPLAAALPELEGQPFLQILDEVFTSGKTFYGDEISAFFGLEDARREFFFNFVYQPITNGGAETTDILVVAVDVTTQFNVRLELQQINEEMAAANEELATTNEELTEVQQRYEEANRELQTSSSRLSMAIESTSLGTWDYQPQTGELYWSNECREIYGIPANEEPTFAVFAEHIHPDDRLIVEQAIEKALNPSGEGHYDLSYRIIRFDTGEPRWIKAQGTVYFDQGQAVRFIGTVIDIHELKEAEEKSAKLAAIIASSDDAIISKTLESVITSWNAAAERVFGYSAAEMIGESIYKLIPPDRYGEEPQILSTIHTGERVEHFETKRLTKDGRLIDVSVTVSPVKDKAGHIIGLSKIARDITEKKLDEARKNDFIGMVSHELKTPLTSLSAIIQVASAKLEDNNDSFLKGAMQKANVQIKRMSAMINGFLNISRLESGKIDIVKQNFDLDELINEVIDETRLTISSHQIEFKSCPPVIVNADRDKINSVISNLISNAVKYSPKGKYITVRCSVDNAQATVSVQDEGMGIKKEDLDQIFNRYFRVETTHTRHISGFGIGLYLSLEIMERHGGKLWAESQSGVGSTFSFSLPTS
jgi:PAS domain S-box-containing protein